MKRFLIPALVLGIFSTSAFVGCEQKTEEKKVDTIKTPGGSSTVTEKTTTEKTGDKKE